MPESFLPFSAFVPDGGDFGPQLAKAQNVLPVHGSFRPLNQKAVLSSVTGGPVTGAYVHVYQQTRAIQFIRPDADNSVGTWATSDGTASLFALVNEASADDAKFIFAGAAPSAQAVKLGLSNPLATTGVSHFLRWRYRIPVLTTSGWTAKAELLQNTTVVATDTATGSAVTAWVFREYALSGPEIAAISDYTALFVRFTATAPGSTQLLAPNADTAAGGWTDAGSGGTNLFASIDESSPSDVDYIQSPALAAGGASATYVGTFATGVNPLGRASHVFHYRYKALNAGVTIKARLKSGATLVKEVVHASASTGLTTVNQALSTTEAALLAPSYAGTLEVEASYPTDVASTVNQTLVPISDDVSIGYVHNGASSTFGCLADASDSTYLTEGNPGEAFGVATVTLASGVDPQSALGHVIACRAYLPTGTTARVSLIEGTTVRAFLDMVGVSSITDYSYALTPAEANSIGSYGAGSLHLKLESFAYGHFIYRAYFQIPVARQAQITWAQLEVPPAQRVEVSWNELELPDGTTSYKGDVPTTIAGIPTKLYEVAASGWTDLSKGGGYAAGGANPGSWSLCSFGNDIIACNYVDPVQRRTNNTGSFADLITSTLRPKARFCAPFRDQLMLAGINLSGHFDDEIWISAVDDATQFDIGNAQTQSDIQRIVSCPGQIMGLVGGDFALVFKRRSLHRIDWTGGPTIFRVSDVTNSIGTPNPRSIVCADGMIYFWGGNSFYRTDGYSVPEKVGADVLARFLTDTDFSDGAVAQFDPGSIGIEDQILSGHYAHHAGCLIWTYQSKTDVSYRHTRAVVYNPSMDLWTAWLLPTGADCALLIQRPNTTGSNTWLLRDTIGFDWDGTTSSYFRFSGATTYEATLHSNKQALGYDDQERPTTTYLKGAIPIFSIAGSGTTPNLSITARVALDPRFVTNLRQETYDANLANEALNYPFQLDGVWFDFDIVVPSLSAEMVVAIKGLWLDWQKSGRSGG